MPLDRDLSALLNTMARDRSYVRPTETDVAGARESHEHDAAHFTPPARRASVADVRQIDLTGHASRLSVRIYRPDVERSRVPTIVWYHGGGWTTGSLDTGDILARALSRDTPAVVASVAYRLAPEHPWPAAVDDAVEALRWVAAHIDELGGDDGSIAVGGDSAGGNLAAVVAQVAPEVGVRLAAQVLFYPFLDLDLDNGVNRYRSLEENASGYYVTLADLRWCVDNYLPPDVDRSNSRISPAQCSDLAGLATAVIAVAEYDPLRDQGASYAEALRAASVPVNSHDGMGLIHGYCDMIGLSPAAASELDRVVGSVRDLLAARVA
jgi:acetyl esterase/lipase